jgi:hypothetical protein
MVRVQVCFGEWYVVSVCVYVGVLRVYVWVQRERSILARQARGRAMLEMEGSSLWTRRRRLAGVVLVRGPLKGKQSRSGLERAVGRNGASRTAAADGGVSEGRREGGGGGDGGSSSEREN